MNASGPMPGCNTWNRTSFTWDILTDNEAGWVVEYSPDDADDDEGLFVFHVYMCVCVCVRWCIDEQFVA